MKTTARKPINILLTVEKHAELAKLAEYSGNAWFVIMYGGSVYYNGKSGYYSFVWPVRAGQVDDSAIERFTDNGDGTITDNTTELMWIKDLN